MITIAMAGLRVAIDNVHDLSPQLREWITQGSPDFTVRVTQQELDREDRGEGLSEAQRELICVYRQIAERLPDYDAFVFHGAALVMDGRCYLFTAPSGTGKTTHAVLWAAAFPHRVWILNGDKPIIRRGPEGFLVCGTPWRGKESMGVPGELPPQGLCLLRRGRENRIAPAAGSELVNFLMQQIYLPRDPARLAKFMDLLDSFCREVPTYIMDCNISLDAPKIAWEAMRPKRAEAEE